MTALCSADRAWIKHSSPAALNISQRVNSTPGCSLTNIWHTLAKSKVGSKMIKASWQNKYIENFRKCKSMFLRLNSALMNWATDTETLNIQRGRKSHERIVSWTKSPHRPDVGDKRGRRGPQARGLEPLGPKKVEKELEVELNVGMPGKRNMTQE